MPFEIVTIDFEAQCQNCPTIIKKGEKRLRYISPEKFRNTTHRVSKSCCMDCFESMPYE